MISEFSLKQETARGESFEAINQRLTEKKQKKNKIKGLMNFYKKRQQESDDDDEQIQEAEVVKKILEEFTEQREAVYKLFFISQNFFMNLPSETFAGYATFPDLENFFRLGFIKTENPDIRAQFQKDVTLLFTRIQGQEVAKAKIIEIMLFKLLPQALESGSRSGNFIETLMTLIQTSNSEHLQPLAGSVEALIEQISKSIVEKPSEEISTDDVDQTLLGNL